MKRFLVPILLVAALQAAFAQTPAKVVIGLASFQATGASDAAAVRRAVDDAVDATALRYGPAYGLATGLAPKYKYTVTAVGASGTTPAMLSVQVAGPGGEPQSIFFYYATPEELRAILPPAFFSLYAQISGLSETFKKGPPRPTYEIRLNDLKDLVLPSGAPTLAAGGLVATADGVVTTAMGSAVYFDARLEFRRSEQIDAKQPYALAYHALSASSGTIGLVTVSGDFYKKPKGSDSFAKAASFGSLPVFSAMSPDGSVFYQDLTTFKFYRVEGRRKAEFPFKSAAPTTMAPFGADADGNLWVYDYMSQIVKVFEPSGNLIDAVRLTPPAGLTLSPQRLHVRPQGGVILVDMSNVVVFDRNGFAERVVSKPASGIDPVQQSAVYASALSPSGDALYLLTMGDYRVMRLELAEPPAASEHGRLATLNAAVAANPDDERAQRARIEALEAAGLKSQAYSCRLVYEECFQSDADNERAIAAYRRGLEAAKIKTLVDAVIAKLQRLGVESARAEYSQALQAFETYLASWPDDGAMASLRDGMVRSFKERENPQALPPPAARVVKARVDDLFPAFMERYRFTPAGAVVVENSSGKPLSGATVSVQIRDLMDFPAETPWKGSIAPGASAELPFFVVLNRSALDIQEDVTVQARVEVKFDSGAVVSSVVPAIVRRRTAITWADTAAIASFVTPNEDTVSTFARDAVYRRKGAADLPFNKTFSKAVGVVDALGALGMAYVEDPNSPFTAVEGKPTVVDTVRFPRVTLASRSGDCDDTTALVASALEATGVRTAIVTTPGHIFVAFATNERESAAKRYAYADYGAIAYKGETWIPVETTILSKGFTEAWRTGYKVWKDAGDKAELIPLAEARASYPALPLPASSAVAPTPSIAELSSLSSKGQDRLVADMLQPALRDAETVLAAKNLGAEAVRKLNETSVLAASFGKYDDAIRILKQAIAAAPTSAALRNNLYWVLVLAGRNADAEKSLKEARAAIPGSPVLDRLAERKAPADSPQRASDATGRGADADGLSADWEF